MGTYSFRLRGTRHALINIVPEVLIRQGFRIVRLDDRKGLITGHRPFMLFRLPAAVTIEVRESEEDIVVVVSAHLRGPFPDFGAGRRIASRIGEWLEEEL
jgi:hypothetical protein